MVVVAISGRGNTLPGVFSALLVIFAVTGCQSRPRPIALRPFVFDGCTCFPEGSRREPSAWSDACEKHDLAYWRGGTMRERREADLALRQGISASGYPAIGTMAYLGVRLGGAAILPTPWRWGFGWKEYPRRPRPLTPAEQAMVRGAP